jgi:hypothetical protein
LEELDRRALDYNFYCHEHFHHFDAVLFCGSLLEKWAPFPRSHIQGVPLVMVRIGHSAL